MLDYENQDDLSDGEGQSDDDVQSGDSPPSSTPQSGFDAAKAVQRMRDQALLKSAGWCARFVRDGLEAGGLDVSGHPQYAKNYGPFLQGRGASVVDPRNYQAQQGDVVVYDGNPRHPSGHVQMYDGSQWISDFKQNHFSPYGSDVPPSTIYRFGGTSK